MCCANNYCELFRTELVDKKLNTVRTRESGSQQDMFGLNEQASRSPSLL